MLNARLVHFYEKKKIKKKDDLSILFFEKKGILNTVLTQIRQKSFRIACLLEANLFEQYSKT